jgi:uncharacterized protein with PQ loop repeat
MFSFKNPRRFSTKSALSVALETWVMYFLGSACMCVYGLVHKQKPILFMNLNILPVYVLIIVCTIIYA